MSACIESLRYLVACDTRNPPRQISGEDEVFSWLREQLPDFICQVTDHGDGSVSFLAVRGNPTRLINIHLDTVPANSAWTTQPLVLMQSDDKVFGLGACDIKGAIAASLAAANQTTGDVALLFTTDEEYGASVCVREFLRTPPAFLKDVELVVVSEPTRCQAVLAHRGFARATARAQGEPGHSSHPRALEENAVHRLAQWLVAAVQEAKERGDDGAAGLSGLRFNCGRISGGVADNIIAANAEAVFSLRPPPSVDPRQAAEALLKVGGGREENSGEVTFVGPPLPATNAEERVEQARHFAQSLQVDEGVPVDFWTEAALFSDAGYCTFVCGPGDIGQAHTAQEWVLTSELERAEAFFIRVMGGAAKSEAAS